MTRVNLVPPRELADQHLFAEWREIKMVPQSLKRSLASKGPDGVLASIPRKFRMGKGHVSFFYNKGTFLQARYNLLTRELDHRGIHDYDKRAVLDREGVYAGLLELYGPNVCAKFTRDYVPDWGAVALSRQRIRENIMLKPTWYRYFGKPLKENGKPE